MISFTKNDRRKLHTHKLQTMNINFKKNFSLEKLFYLVTSGFFKISYRMKKKVRTIE